MKSLGVILVIVAGYQVLVVSSDWWWWVVIGVGVSMAMTPQKEYNQIKQGLKDRFGYLNSGERDEEGD